LPLATDGIPSEGFGEISDVQIDGLDIISAITENTDFITGILSTLPTASSVLQSSALALRDKHLSIPANGYLDLNGSLSAGGIPLGITFGVVIDSQGLAYGYIGGGFMSPGFAATVSSLSVSTGWNFGFQFGNFGLVGQGGYSISGDPFYEVGAGMPGASLTGYYIFHIPNINTDWEYLKDR